MSFFLIDAIFSSIPILYFTLFIASSNIIISHIARWQYSATSLIELVTSYNSLRFLIFLGGVPLLELSLEKEEEVELIGVYRGVTIGSWWSSYLSCSSSRIDKKSYFSLSLTF